MKHPKTSNYNSLIPTTLDNEFAHFPCFIETKLYSFVRYKRVAYYDMKVAKIQSKVAVLKFRYDQQNLEDQKSH